MPAEVVESLSPLVFRRRELTPRLGRRGALPRRPRAGSRDHLLDRRRAGPSRDCSTGRSIRRRASRAAAPGAAGAYRLLGGDDLPIKRVVALRPSDAVELRLPGGGGYGAPTTRDAEAVLARRRRGLRLARAGARALRRRRSATSGPTDALVRPRASYELDREGRPRPVRARVQRRPEERLTSRA